MTVKVMIKNFLISADYAATLCVILCADASAGKMLLSSFNEKTELFSGEKCQPVFCTCL